MCLRISNKAAVVNLFLKQPKIKGEIVCYKILKKIDKYGFVNKNGPYLTSPIRNSPYSLNKWKKSRRTLALTKHEKTNNEINKGIHVYLSLAAAKETLNFRDDCFYKIYKVKCKVDDLVALGYDNRSTRKCAVFTKVFLPKQ